MVSGHSKWSDSSQNLKNNIFKISGWFGKQSPKWPFRWHKNFKQSSKGHFGWFGKQSPKWPFCWHNFGYYLCASPKFFPLQLYKLLKILVRIMLSYTIIFRLYNFFGLRPRKKLYKRKMIVYLHIITSRNLIFGPISGTVK